MNSVQLIHSITLFIKEIDSLSSQPILSQNIEFLFITMPVWIGLIIFNFLAGFISKDMFESGDPNSGLLFNRKSIFQQGRELFIVIPKTGIVWHS